MTPPIITFTCQVRVDDNKGASKFHIAHSKKNQKTTGNLWGFEKTEK